MVQIYNNSELYKKAEKIGEPVRKAFAGGATPPEATTSATPANANPTAFGGKSVVDHVIDFFSRSAAGADIARAFGTDPTGAYEAGPNLGAISAPVPTPPVSTTPAINMGLLRLTAPSVPKNVGAKVSSPAMPTDLGVENKPSDLLENGGFVSFGEMNSEDKLDWLKRGAALGKNPWPGQNNGSDVFTKAMNEYLQQATDKARTFGTDPFSMAVRAAGFKALGDVARLSGQFGAEPEKLAFEQALKGAQFEETKRHNEATEKNQAGQLDVQAMTAKAHKQNIDLLVDKWGFEKEHLKRFPPGAVTEAIKKATDETTGEFKPGVMRSILTELDTFYNRPASQTAGAGQSQKDIKLLNDKKYFK